MCVGTTGMPLLQLAVRSQRIDLVRALIDWGEQHGESVGQSAGQTAAACDATACASQIDTCVLWCY